MVGFCNVEVKLFGPLHEYVAAGTVLEVSDSICPEQIGELLPGVGVVGGGLIVTTVVAALLVQPAAEVVVTE